MEIDYQEFERLRAALRPPGAGADLIATNERGLVKVEPLTARAELWLTSRTAEEASWFGGALIVELRYFSRLADAAIDAGLSFERASLPN